MTTKDIEAQVSLPDGTQITVKGGKGSVADILTSIAGTARSRGQSGADPSRGGSLPGSTVVGTLAGVAEKDDGNVHIIASDLKAKSAREAAHRLIYITLYARSVLLNEKKSPRKALVEALKNYNLYDGNTRRLVVSDKGVVREGKKTIWLSQPAAEVARKFIKEIQDSDTKGSWGISSIGAASRRRGGKTVRGTGASDNASA